MKVDYSSKFFICLYIFWVAMIIAKIGDFITISWWWILCPAWLPLTVFIFMAFAFFIFFSVTLLFLLVNKVGR